MALCQCKPEVLRLILDPRHGESVQQADWMLDFVIADRGVRIRLRARLRRDKLRIEPQKTTEYDET